MAERRPGAEITVGGSVRGLGAPRVRRLVRGVLRGERRKAEVSVTFLGARAMRTLNRRWKRHDRPTDVISFALGAGDGALTGDIYICPEVARREARRRGLTINEELSRLVIHGTLHVLGWDHPEGGSRERSPMWRRQERYLERL
ncbi:MAG TPA: rRNA maturation RNase YbeY [Gemmatimonadales bacterium]|nr:rRNA maturation RNase YbeY [Gemmatimonadales bacterium]